MKQSPYMAAIRTSDDMNTAIQRPNEITRWREVAARIEELPPPIAQLILDAVTAGARRQRLTPRPGWVAEINNPFQRKSKT